MLSKKTFHWLEYSEAIIYTIMKDYALYVLDLESEIIYGIIS